tara:strand:- start:266 stop:1855 length:1590 start_codon:yes stop_codon:yes gene_type:complete
MPQLESTFEKMGLKQILPAYLTFGRYLHRYYFEGSLDILGRGNRAATIRRTGKSDAGDKLSVVYKDTQEVEDWSLLFPIDMPTLETDALQRGDFAMFLLMQDPDPWAFPARVGLSATPGDEWIYKFLFGRVAFRDYSAQIRELAKDKLNASGDPSSDDGLTMDIRQYTRSNVPEMKKILGEVAQVKRWQDLGISYASISESFTDRYLAPVKRSYGTECEALQQRVLSGQSWAWELVPMLQKEVVKTLVLYKGDAATRGKLREIAVELAAGGFDVKGPVLEPPQFEEFNSCGGKMEGNRFGSCLLERNLYDSAQRAYEDSLGAVASNVAGERSIQQQNVIRAEESNFRLIALKNMLEEDNRKVCIADMETWGTGKNYIGVRRVVKIGFDAYTARDVITKVRQADGRARRLDSFQHLLPDMDDVEFVWFTDLPVDCTRSADPTDENDFSIIPQDALYGYSSRSGRHLLKNKFAELAFSVFEKNNDGATLAVFYESTMKDVRLGPRQTETPGGRAESALRSNLVKLLDFCVR